MIESRLKRETAAYKKARAVAEKQAVKDNAVHSVHNSVDDYLNPDLIDGFLFEF